METITLTYDELIAVLGAAESQLEEYTEIKMSARNLDILKSAISRLSLVAYSDDYVEAK